MGGYPKKTTPRPAAAQRPPPPPPNHKKQKPAVDAAGRSALPADRQISEQIDLLDRQRAVLTPDFQDARGRVGALTYQLEQIPENDKSAKASKLKALNEARAATYELNWPAANGTDLRKFNYDDLNNTFTGIMSEKSALVARRGDQDKSAKDAQSALDAFVDERLHGLGSADLQSLL